MYNKLNNVYISIFNLRGWLNEYNLVEPIYAEIFNTNDWELDKIKKEVIRFFKLPELTEIINKLESKDIDTFINDLGNIEAPSNHKLLVITYGLFVALKNQFMEQKWRQRNRLNYNLKLDRDYKIDGYKINSEKLFLFQFKNWYLEEGYKKDFDIWTNFIERNFDNILSILDYNKEKIGELNIYYCGKGDFCFSKYIIFN